MQATRAKYDQLIQDLRRDLRPQREWGEGRGIFMVIGHFVVGVASGTWLFALLFDSRAGLALAFALAGLGGIAHLAYLGRPERFWKMVVHVRTSWISRGFVGLSLFLAGALLYLVPLFIPAAPWGRGSVAAGVGNGMAIVGMLVLMGYMGFVYTASKAIPFWNSPLHPALYIAYALRGGIAALLLTLALGARSSASVGELLLLWAGVTAVVIVFFLLEIHGAMTSGNAAARRSVHDLFAGRVAIYFYVGTLALGLLVPAWLARTGLSDSLSLSAIAALGLASALGDFFMKYAVIRAGVYLPVWTRLVPQR
jgi:sulfite dehydrogenase (quinone) subunit SoeC